MKKMLFLSLVLSVVSLGSAMANDADMSRNRGPKKIIINVTAPPRGVCADHNFHCCPPPAHHKPHHDCCDFGHNHHNKPGKPHGHFNHGKGHGKPGKNYGRDDFRPNGRPGGAYGHGAPGRR